MLEIELETQSTGNLFLDDLLSFIDEQEIQEMGLDTADTSYAIKDITHANYIVKKLLEARKQMKVINDTANNQIESYKQKVELWREKSIGPLANSEAFFLELLYEFGKRQLEGSTKKSMKLIEGTLQFRKTPDKFEYDDETLLNYLETNLPEYIKQKPQIEKAKLKEMGKVKDGKLYIADNIVPGIAIIPQEESFDVK